MTDNTELNEIELSQESNVDTQEQEETINNEPVFAEEPRIPEPWENALEGLVYYEKMYDDGHLGSFTKSAELAYKFGWFDNSIPEEDLEVSDVNGWTYLKSKCPHKTQADIDRENAIQEISQLKKQLSDTDYKAIKYAEGQISEDEYASVRAERQGYRDRINELEALL